MKIAITGSSKKVEELHVVLSSAGPHEIISFESTKNIPSDKFDVVIDLNFDDSSHFPEEYLSLDSNTLLLLSSVKIQLEAVVPSNIACKVAGFNALSGFIANDSIEYCSLSDIDESLLLALGWKKALKVDSRIGLVSPRVILTIINEAFFTLQEGTAGKEDINLGLKLGTAYPFGPFEWCEKIGVRDVYEVLYALYQDTMDERYKICNALKTEYLKLNRSIPSR